MFLYPSAEEGLAWLQAGDEDRAGYAAAVKRGEDEAAADDTGS
jgi:hypothetical protein